jgi:hypothetical protein
VEELFSYVPPEDERATLTVNAGRDKCSVICTWSYDGVSVDLTPDKARELGQILIRWADDR